MSLGAGSLNLFLPIIERISRVPGRALVVAAGIANAILLLLGWQAGQRHGGFGGWFPFGAGVVFTAVLIFFAVRRKRLEQRLDAYTEAETNRYAQTAGTTAVGEISASPGWGIVLDEDGTVIAGSDPEGMSAEAELLERRDRQRAAEAESARRKNTFMPRLEAAQRAAIASAGGIENAAYLRDDLRWTILSALITAVSLPLIGVLGVVALIMWL